MVAVKRALAFTRVAVSHHAIFGGDSTCTETKRWFRRKSDRCRAHAPQFATQSKGQTFFTCQAIKWLATCDLSGGVLLEDCSTRRSKFIVDRAYTGTRSSNKLRPRMHVTCDGRSKSHVCGLYFRFMNKRIGTPRSACSTYHITHT